MVIEMSTTDIAYTEWTVQRCILYYNHGGNCFVIGSITKEHTSIYQGWKNDTYYRYLTEYALHYYAWW